MDTVTYSINNSCGTNSATRAITVVDCSTTSVGTIAEPGTLTIFPNPALNVLNIKWSDWAEENTIVISDVTGREMVRNTVTGSGPATQEINVSNLPAGIYLLRVNESEVRKFVKE